MTTTLDDEVSLVFRSGYARDHKVEQHFIAVKDFIQSKLANNEPVYVKFKDSRREGAIGRIQSIHMDSSDSRYGYKYYYVDQIKIVWDDRKNVVKPYNRDIILLPNCTEPTTVWAWEQTAPKPKEPAIIPKDHLGEDIHVGMFVSFIHRRYKNINLKFGTVTRISEKGSIWVNTLKLRDGDRPEEVKVYSADSVTILNENLMSRLVLARMAAN